MKVEKINYGKIITVDLKDVISENELNELKEEARKERICIRPKEITYPHMKGTMPLCKKADEKIYLSNDFQKKNSIEKALLVANIVFENDETFAKRLQTKGSLIGEKSIKETLTLYRKLLNYLKVKKAHGGDFTEEDINVEKWVLKLTTNMITRLSIYYDELTTDEETVTTLAPILINKINEILSFNPELLETKATVNKNVSYKSLKKLK